VPVIPSKFRIFRFTQYVSAFGFSAVLADQLRVVFFHASLLPCPWAFVSQHVLLLKCTHPGAPRHPSKDGIQIKSYFRRIATGRLFHFMA